MYDAHGMDGVNMGAGGAGAGGPGGFGGFGGFRTARTAEEEAELLRHYQDLFRQFSGGGRGGGMDFMEELFGRGHGAGGMSRVQGDDIQLNLRISFQEAIHGVKKSVTYEALAACGTCDGSGQKPGTTPTKCSACKGQGHTTMRQQGFMVRPHLMERAGCGLEVRWLQWAAFSMSENDSSRIHASVCACPPSNPPT